MKWQLLRQKSRATVAVPGQFVCREPADFPVVQRDSRFLPDSERFIRINDPSSVQNFLQRREQILVHSRHDGVVGFGCRQRAQIPLLLFRMIADEKERGIKRSCGCLPDKLRPKHLPGGVDQHLPPLADKENGNPVHPRVDDSSVGGPEKLILSFHLFQKVADDASGAAGPHGELALRRKRRLLPGKELPDQRPKLLLRHRPRLIVAYLTHRSSE
ncbi:hypothetical protein SDC9_168975 [bioreactor metagenome]|uniref:Uncharacterized protein n=1 Tax=bioreactor metagenome TaxID=1076179 RepID=A0A645G4M0_9ZZZZ